LSDEQGGEISGEATDPGAEILRKELDRNVEKPSEVPSGYQLQGPGEPGAEADVPGVLGGPGINIISEDEDEPDNRWSEHPR
jgi:hypothetical protein